MAEAEPRWLEGIKGDGSRQLIESDGRVIKALAGPGTGKTTCLKRRVMRLVDLKLVQKPSEIFVGTFTRVIAKSLREAFVPPIDGGEASYPVVATLHSHAAMVLRANRHAVQGREFRFLLQHEEAVMLYDIADKVKHLENQAKRNDRLRKLQAEWANRRSVEDATFAGAVEEWLRLHGGMLLGEVVFLATNGVASGNLAPPRYKHVFVDEYQDLTECEQTYVDFIVDPEGSIVVLGDNDQSIYGFRYNHPDGIAAFPSDDSRKAVVANIDLPDNFRCAPEIVDLANEIAAMGGTTKPPMSKAVKTPGSVTFVRWEVLDQEIEGIADVVKSRRNDRFLILVTRQFIGYRLKNAIGDDAVTTFHEEVLGVRFVRDRFALAALFANENDAVALRAWLSLHGTDSGPADHRNVEAYQSATISGLHGMALLAGIASGDVPLSGAGQENVRNRAVSYLEFKAKAPKDDLKQLIELLFDPHLVSSMPGRHRPAKETESERKARERLEAEDREKATSDFDLLRRAALESMERLESPNLEKIIDRLRYRIGTRAPLLDDESVPRVRIMTLHGAKGLEEDNVIVCGLADEIIPGPPQEDAFENAKREAEQRRLLYVAVTRAKKDLVLSWSTCINSVDVRPNAIVEKAIVSKNAGVFYRHLTRTRLLPPQRAAFTDGQAWREQQLALAGNS